MDPICWHHWSYCTSGIDDCKLTGAWRRVRRRRVQGGEQRPAANIAGSFFGMRGFQATVSCGFEVCGGRWEPKKIIISLNWSKPGKGDNASTWNARYARKALRCSGQVARLRSRKCWLQLSATRTRHLRHWGRYATVEVDLEPLSLQIIVPHTDQERCAHLCGIEFPFM